MWKYVVLSSESMLLMMFLFWLCMYVCGFVLREMWVRVQGCEKYCLGLLWILIVLSNVPFIPAIISCAFLIPNFWGIFICDSSCYLEFLLCAVIELAVNFQDNTVREDVEFHTKKKSIWGKRNKTVKSCVQLTSILLWAHTERRQAVLWHWHLGVVLLDHVHTIIFTA